jgi:hypothetical protein
VGFPPNDDLLSVRGSVLHFRCAIAIEVQKTEVSLRLQGYHEARARAVHIGVFKIEREPLGHVWDLVVVTSVVQDCTCGDSRRHHAVAFSWGQERRVTIKNQHASGSPVLQYERTISTMGVRPSLQQANHAIEHQVVGGIRARRLFPA